MKRDKNERAHRAQVAALPVRHASDGGLEVLLITSRETRRWVIPKGWPMPDRKDYQAAAREALEEAGISGRIRKRPLGAYTYQKRLVDRVEPCRVMVYVLEVDKERVAWRERDQRERQWFTPDTAADNVDEPRLAAMIRSLGQGQGGPGQPGRGEGGRDRGERDEAGQDEAGQDEAGQDELERASSAAASASEAA